MGDGPEPGDHDPQKQECHAPDQGNPRPEKHEHCDGDEHAQVDGSGSQHIRRVGCRSSQTASQRFAPFGGAQTFGRVPTPVGGSRVFRNFTVRGTAVGVQRRDRFDSAHAFNFPTSGAILISCVLADRGEDNPTARERRLRRGGDGRHIRGQPDSAGTSRQRMAWTAPRNDRGDDKGAVATGRSKRLRANSGVVGS